MVSRWRVVAFLAVLAWTSDAAADDSHLVLSAAATVGYPFTVAADAGIGWEFGIGITPELRVGTRLHAANRSGVASPWLLTFIPGVRWSLNSDGFIIPSGGIYLRFEPVVASGGAGSTLAGIIFGVEVRGALAFAVFDWLRLGAFVSYALMGGDRNAAYWPAHYFLPGVEAALVL